MITVYSKPACVQCKYTTRELDKLHLEYQTIDVTQDAEAYAFVQSLGYLSAPVVYADENNHWMGFKVDQLRALSPA